MSIKREIKQFVKKTRGQDILAMFAIKVLLNNRLEFTCVPSSKFSPTQVKRIRSLLKEIAALLTEVVEEKE